MAINTPYLNRINYQFFIQPCLQYTRNTLSHVPPVQITLFPFLHKKWSLFALDFSLFSSQFLCVSLMLFFYQCLILILYLFLSAQIAFVILHSFVLLNKFVTDSKLKTFMRKIRAT